MIATKGGYTRSGPNQWKPNLQPKHLREALEGSLKRLKLERIDVYQLHNAADHSVKLADAIGELAIMQSEGKIRHIGVSNFSVAQLAEARSIVSVVSVQNRYNLGDRASEAVLKECEKLNIPFLPWAPLGKSNSAATAALENVAKRHGATTGQIAIAALLAHSPMMLPIPGTSRVAHLEENIAAAGIELTAEEQKELSLTAVRYRFAPRFFPFRRFQSTIPPQMSRPASIDPAGRPEVFVHLIEVRAELLVPCRRARRTRRSCR